MNRQNAALWLGGFLLLFGMVIFVQSFAFDYYSQFGPGPGLLPRWLSGALILLSLLYIGLSIKKERISFDEILPKEEGRRKLLIILSSMVGFIVIVPYIGFLVAGTLLMFVLLMGGYKWYYNLMISAGVSAFLFWLFGSFLSVPLPTNYFGF
jgi:putative tricarboxylic transport membrane protein